MNYPIYYIIENVSILKGANSLKFVLINTNNIKEFVKCWLNFSAYRNDDWICRLWQYLKQRLYQQSWVLLYCSGWQFFDHYFNGYVNSKIFCEFIDLSTYLFNQKWYDFQIVERLLLISIKWNKESQHSLDCERTALVIWPIILLFLLLKTVLRNVEV